MRDHRTIANRFWKDTYRLSTATGIRPAEKHPPHSRVLRPLHGGRGTETAWAVPTARQPVGHFSDCPLTVTRSGVTVRATNRWLEQFWRWQEKP